MSTEFSAFAYGQQHFDEIAQDLALSPAMRAFLRTPMREFHFTIPVKMDDGSYRTFQALRVQHNDARGPAMGGVRFFPDDKIDTIDMVRYLALCMTYNTALADLPVSGAKGCVICDPAALSVGELERLSRGYVRGAAGFMGADKDVLAPDVYVTPQIMAWMLDEYEAIHERSAPGTVLGKPVALFGSQGRSDAIGRGGICVTGEAARILGMDLHGATAALQGCGNVGQAAHLRGRDLVGLKFVAVSDPSGGYYNPDGLAPEALLAQSGQHPRRVLEGFPDAGRISNAELLELPVDVLFLAALEHVITRENAPRIKAKMIVGLADGPTTPEADAILEANGAIVLPNCLCNAGGMVVAHFEQAQNAIDSYWSREQIAALLEGHMVRAFRAVHEYARSQGVSYQAAGCRLAVQRVADAVALRGWAR